MNDAFVAFWAGLAAGIVLGFMFAAIATAVMNSIEGSNKNGRDQEDN